MLPLVVLSHDVLDVSVFSYETDVVVKDAGVGRILLDRVRVGPVVVLTRDGDDVAIGVVLGRSEVKVVLSETDFLIDAMRSRWFEVVGPECHV